MDVILQRFIQNVGKMRAFGAVAVGVIALVVHLFHRLGKELLRVPDPLGDNRQVGQFKRCSILLHYGHKVDAVEEQVVVLHLKSFLREDKGLVDEVVVVVLQCLAKKSFKV